jgi:hypothetical protein
MIGLGHKVDFSGMNFATVPFRFPNSEMRDPIPAIHFEEFCISSARTQFYASLAIEEISRFGACPAELQFIRLDGPDELGSTIVTAKRDTTD